MLNVLAIVCLRWIGCSNCCCVFFLDWQGNTRFAVRTSISCYHEKKEKERKRKREKREKVGGERLEKQICCFFLHCCLSNHVAFVDADVTSFNK